MGWLSLAAGLMKFVNIILGMIDRERLMKAGEARNVVKAMEELNAEIAKAHGAIGALKSDPIWIERVRKLGDRDA